MITTSYVTSFVPPSLSNYSEQFISFAQKFPAAAFQLYSLFLSFTLKISTLSPKARANLHALVLCLWSAMLWLYHLFLRVYTYVMKIPQRPHTQWQAPIAVMLQIVSRCTLFFFPTELSNDLEIENGKTYVFISNRNVYSLDAIPLVARIYQSTGIWPRFATDPYHFKVPLWKHIIEYFGAFPYDSHIVSKIVASGQSVIVSPGGLKETLKSKNISSYRSEWNSGFLDSFPEDALLVPVSCIGPNDMFEHIFDLDISPILWLFGIKESRQTLPILYPKSFQRSYISLGPVEQNRNECKITKSVDEGIKRLMVLRENDPRRYLLTRIGGWLQKGNVWIMQVVQSGKTKALAVNLFTKLKDAGIYCLENGPYAQ